jgi:hypothetical protein
VRVRLLTLVVVRMQVVRVVGEGGDLEPMTREEVEDCRRVERLDVDV